MADRYLEPGRSRGAHAHERRRRRPEQELPLAWQRIGRPGDRHYSGPRALSEPESKLLALLIERLRPQVTIWFHQPYGVVDESGGDVAIERRFASLAGLPLQRLPRYPGGVTDWQNARFPGTTSFVVELPAGFTLASAYWAICACRARCRTALVEDGAEGARTPGLRDAIAALSQLSYGPLVQPKCSGEVEIVGPLDLLPLVVLCWR